MLSVLSMVINPLASAVMVLVVSGFAVSGALLVGGVYAATGGDFWEGAAKGAMYGAVLGAIVFAAVSLPLALKKMAHHASVAKMAQAASAAKPTTTAGMQAGTVQVKQKHHFLTNKHSKFTPKFREITDKYGLKLNDPWNVEMLTHKGRHATEYHKYMLEAVRGIDKIASGDQAIFLAKFQGVKNTVIQNPAMMYKNHWLTLLGV